MSEEKNKNQSHWYAVHTYPGYEEAVARYLKQRIDSLEMHDKIFDILVPKEKKIKIQKGKRRIIEERIYPGYVFVRMVLTEDSWYVVRNTPRVTGFLGADSTRPTPLNDEQVEELLRMTKKEEPEFKLTFSLGDVVRISDGPFKGYEGKISEIDKQRGKIKVLVPIFGRETPVEIDFLQAKKIG
ncbi:transcription termination/antitermination factor NusG [bacterium]|nr:transcription termination/antitermination factor NusG [bacterium]